MQPELISSGRVAEDPRSEGGDKVVEDLFVGFALADHGGELGAKAAGVGGRMDEKGFAPAAGRLELIGKAPLARGQSGIGLGGDGRTERESE